MSERMYVSSSYSIDFNNQSSRGKCEVPDDFGDLRVEPGYKLGSEWLQSRSCLADFLHSCLALSARPTDAFAHKCLQSGV